MVRAKKPPKSLTVALCGLTKAEGQLSATVEMAMGTYYVEEIRNGQAKLKLVKNRPASPSTELNLGKP